MDFFNVANMHLETHRMSADASFAPLLNRNGGIGAGDFAALLERTRGASAGNDNAARTPGIPAGVRDEKLYQLCLELETFLVKNLLSSMRSTVQKSGLIDQGFAGQIYEDMLYDEYAKSLTMNAGFGLAKQAYLQLTGR